MGEFEHLEIATARKDLADSFDKPTDDQAAEMIRVQLIPLGQQDLDLIRQKLPEFRQDSYKSNNRWPSRTRLTAELVYRTGDGWLTHAQEQLERNIEQFVFYWDVAYGVAEVASRVILAEETIAGHAEEQIADAVSMVQEWEESGASSHLGSYLKFNQLAIAESQLLLEDPNGLLVVNSVIENLVQEAENTKTGWARFLIPQFVIGGANFARQMYEQLYPLTEDSR